MNEGSPAEVDWDFMNKEIAQTKGFAADAKGMNKGLYCIGYRHILFPTFSYY